MVHALENVGKILSPGGFLINVHDLPIPHGIEVQSAGKTNKMGWLFASENFNLEHLAYSAVTQVVLDGLFTLADEHDFEYKVYADGIKEFQDWLADTWETAFIPDITLKQINNFILAANSPTKVILKEPSRMTKLQIV